MTQLIPYFNLKLYLNNNNNKILFSGGGTGYDFPTKEMLVEPTRGSAAFWINRRTNGKTEALSSHGGCPGFVTLKILQI